METMFVVVPLQGCKSGKEEVKRMLNEFYRENYTPFSIVLHEMNLPKNTMTFKVVK